jgi:hypothetical protein
MSDTEKTKEKSFDSTPSPFLMINGRIKISKKERISMTPSIFQSGLIPVMHSTPTPDRTLTEHKSNAVSSIRRRPACSWGMPYLGPFITRAPSPQTFPGMYRSISAVEKK